MSKKNKHNNKPNSPKFISSEQDRSAKEIARVLKGFQNGAPQNIYLTIPSSTPNYVSNPNDGNLVDNKNNGNLNNKSNVDFTNPTNSNYLDKYHDARLDSIEKGIAAQSAVIKAELSTQLTDKITNYFIGFTAISVTILVAMITFFFSIENKQDDKLDSVNNKVELKAKDIEKRLDKLEMKDSLKFIQTSKYKNRH